MYKNIILDLGGVILDIDYQLPIDGFKKIGVNDFDSYFTQSIQHELLDDFDEGKINAFEFYKNICSMLKINISFEYFEKIWNSIIIKLNYNKIETLLELKKNYKLILFSNTNEIHYNYYSIFLQDIFDNIFDAQYYSHIFGYRKPKAIAFEKIMLEQNILPKETIFIDDSIQHINTICTYKLVQYNYINYEFHR